jgi:hypothetical protein
MAGIPIFCDNCKLVFSTWEPRGSSVTIRGAKHICPRCGFPADIIEATYTGAIDGRIAITGYSAKDRKIVEILQHALRAVQAGGDEELIITELGLVDNNLGALARAAKNKGGYILLFAVLALLLHSCTMNVTFDLNEFLKQVQEIIDAQPSVGPSEPQDAQPPDVQGSTVEPESRTQAQDNNDKEPQQSRQQRPQQERQTRKQQPSPERSKPPSKGASPPKGKGGTRKST